MLDRAQFLVVSEISEVMGENSELIEDKVEKALGRCLVNRGRRLAKAKAAKAKATKAKAAKAKATRAKTAKAKAAKVKISRVKLKKASTGSQTRRAARAS